jgi:hypothetical protein
VIETFQHEFRVRVLGLKTQGLFKELDCPLGFLQLEQYHTEIIEGLHPQGVVMSVV